MTADRETRPDPNGCPECGRLECPLPAALADTSRTAERWERRRIARAECNTHPRIDWQAECRALYFTARSSPPRSAPAAAWSEEPPRHTDIIAHGSYWFHRLRERQLIVEVDDDGDVYRMSAEPCGNVRDMGGEWRPVCSSDSAPAAPGIVEAALTAIVELDSIKCDEWAPCVGPVGRAIAVLLKLVPDDGAEEFSAADRLAALRAALGKDTK